jgi:hypothetical protein
VADTLIGSEASHRTVSRVEAKVEPSLSEALQTRIWHADLFHGGVCCRRHKYLRKRTVSDGCRSPGARPLQPTTVLPARVPTPELHGVPSPELDPAPDINRQAQSLALSTGSACVRNARISL